MRWLCSSLKFRMKKITSFTIILVWKLNIDGSTEWNALIEATYRYVVVVDNALRTLLIKIGGEWEGTEEDVKKKMGIIYSTVFKWHRHLNLWLQKQIKAVGLCWRLQGKKDFKEGFEEGGRWCSFDLTIFSCTKKQTSSQHTGGYGEWLGFISW